ncbi:MAG: hypothetical protein VB055_07295 [Oscillospiraceae bacterium]|nr:hypothetical protein [Oscillospiraceae bacterium]
MKKEQISDALNMLNDDIIEETESVRSHVEPAQHACSTSPGRHSQRISRTLIIAAIIAALLALCGFAAYVYWHMPDKGETYEGENIQVHDTQNYPVTDQTDTSAHAETTELSDEWFIQQTSIVLDAVNKQNTDASSLTVSRQTNQMWSREEVLVSFSDEKNNRSEAKFDAQSGYLIGVTAFDEEIVDGTPMSDSDALEIAQSYYDTLPYAEGYVFDYVEKYDDHAWSFDFDKQIQVELWGETLNLCNEYEQVRIVIDPCTGTFQLSNSFYVPLLDDHAPGAEAITKEEAVTVVENQNHLFDASDDYSLSAEIGICLPDPGGMSSLNGMTESSDENYKYYGLTRLGWILTFESQPNEFGMISQYKISVDLYTGEILSIGVAG